MNKNPSRKAVVTSLGAFGVENASFKHTDNGFAEIDELSKRWDNRLTINSTRFAERYVKGGLWLCVEMTFMKSGAEKFVACFQGLSKDCGIQRLRWPVIGDGHVFESRCGRDDSSVFIKDVELMEHPQSVPLPSLVGLYPADEFFDKTSRTPRDFEKLRCFAIRQAIQRSRYWEVGFFDGSVGRVASFDHKACCKVIQGTPGIMDNVSDACAPMLGDWFQQFDPVNLDGWFRIFVSNDAIRFSIPESGDFSAKISKVLIGPVDLLTAAV